jgi:hypothetical protein
MVSRRISINHGTRHQPEAPARDSPVPRWRFGLVSHRKLHGIPRKNRLVLESEEDSNELLTKHPTSASFPMSTEAVPESPIPVLGAAARGSSGKRWLRGRSRPTGPGPPDSRPSGNVGSFAPGPAARPGAAGSAPPPWSGPVQWPCGNVTRKKGPKPWMGLSLGRPSDMAAGAGRRPGWPADWGPRTATHPAQPPPRKSRGLPLAQYAFLWMTPRKRVIHRMRKSSQGVQWVM